MQVTAKSALFGAALLLAITPVVYAKDGSDDDNDDADEVEIHTSAGHASSTATSTRKELKKGDKFEEMLAKFREKLEKERTKKGNRATSTRSTWSKGSSVANVDASCVQKAVDTREVALQSAFNKSNASISDALKARQTALYAAWGTTDVAARNTALKAAWQTWKDARSTAAKTLKTERDAAWKTFKTTVKDTCKASVPTEDASAGSDSAGQTAI